MKTATPVQLTCPECRRDNEAERIYCHDCGARLDRSALAGYTTGKKEKLNHPLIDFERAIVAFTEGNCRVTIERSIFGYSIFTSADYAVQIAGGKVTASPKSGAIGRMPIDPSVMPYAGFLFSDAVAAMNREHKLLNKVGSIQLHDKEIVVTSAQ